MTAAPHSHFPTQDPFAPHGDRYLAGPPRPLAPVPAPMPPAAPPAPAGTDTTAVLALAAAFVVPVVGVVLGLVARRRIARTGAGGRGLATAGVVLGSVFSAMWVLTIAAVIALGGTLSVAASTTPSVPASTVEAQIVAEAGLPAGSVTCPQDLPATVGAATTCSVAVGDGTTLPVDVTVTSAEGDDVRFSFSSR